MSDLGTPNEQLRAAQVTARESIVEELMADVANVAALHVERLEVAKSGASQAFVVDAQRRHAAAVEALREKIDGTLRVVSGEVF